MARKTIPRPTEIAPILIVDDEELIRDTLAEYLTQQGFEVNACNSGERALEEAARRPFAIALCDMQLPGMNGLALLDRLQQLSPETSVLLITAFATVENAVEAFQRGAHDYLMKPILLDEVAEKIRRLLAMRDLALENQWLRRELNRARPEARLIGSSPVMMAVLEMIRKVAPTRSTVLIVGESGTGKELAARAIHDQAGETSGRFLAVNCAAIPHDLLENQLFGHRRGAYTGAERDVAGVFVHAGRGTVFLDEVGEMALATQAKLLRAIEQKEVMPVGANEPVKVEARILAATNKNLMKEVEAGKFREDLYYRLNVVTVSLPPLRERREDIPVIVEHLLARHAESLGKRVAGVTHEAMQRLLSYRWRGNVRELDNTIQRAVILGEGPLIAPEDLPPDLVPAALDPAPSDRLSDAVERFEKAHIERILRQTPDKREAAKRLDIGLSSLYRRIDQLKIQP
ncbi:MAG: sigma-54-dependent Fis family transcriptional regulator [Planctomycetia bacterium]|nr:sigma-54-dependent Fis family transcriptional regulator [Planctomycetia bacterium]